MEQKSGYSCRVLLQGGMGEIVEKKSRFIATVRKTQSREEAESFIEEMKKKYWDAGHNCSAFVVGRNAELTRCSDDGEPAGTAGRPMLEVLLGEELKNVTAVVTRYFGGILLGTGGLVRAYTQALKAGLGACSIGIERLGEEILLQSDYNDIGRVQYLLGQRGFTPLSSEYTDQVKVKLIVPVEKSKELYKAIAESTCARVKWVRQKELYYIDKEER